MADGNGQKGIKNSLLSAATGNNFFEEAAMLVPVPIVEPQEPAIAEIDLNSDDSSSNRGSIEKELPEQLNATLLEEESSSDPFDEKPPPISLFSRATTGVDAFTRMLAGTSAPAHGITEYGSSDAPAVAQFSQESASTTAPGPMTTSGQFAPASSIFSTGSSSPLFPSVSSNPIPPPIFSTPNVPPAVFNPGPPLPQTTTTLASSPFSTSSSFTSPPPPMLPFSNNSQGDALPTKPPTLSPIPPSPSGTPSIANIPPPVAQSGSNTYRLGGQRMKYVPCPEIKSPPIAPGTIAAPSMSMSMQPPPYTPTMMPAITDGGVQLGASSAFTTSNSMAAGTPSIPLNPKPATTVMSAFSTTSGFQAPELGPRPSATTTTVGSPYFAASGMADYAPQELSALTYHWFFRKDVDGKVVWKPFTLIDSVALEEAYGKDPDGLVPTDGARYDVCVSKRMKMPVYWDEAPVEVRRGSWFYKGPMDSRFIPYEEDFCLKLEKEYADCMKTGTWHKRLQFPEGEFVIIHAPDVIVHFCQAAAPDDWGNLPESQIRPRVVKRGVEEIEVEDGESTQIDHLVFVVHGIGPICDFKLRNIVEAVDDFRGLSFQLLNSHFKESIDKNLVGRVEFLPVSWHKALHGDKGIDEQLKRITLRSIPKFRAFTNDTLLDILFYTSPMYCQTIIDSVVSELNRIYDQFLTRNPTFKGTASLVGHSLGSLILFDVLAHQQAGSTAKDAGLHDEGQDVKSAEGVTTEANDSSSSSRTINYTVGNAGTGQPFITYPSLTFAPTSFYALGSPIGMFVTIRGIENLGTEFRLPTCPAFFNIFHPYDPVAYRIEMLIDPNFQSRPVLIPHHKGRKRIHLELKETMARVGADLKHRVIDAVKNTINTVYHYTGFNKSEENLENEIDSAIAGEMEKKSEADGAEDENTHLKVGMLNGGRRIDYVLQEAPYETFNEYLFALSTHCGYWESEDSMLLILSNIYDAMGIQKDTQIPAAQVVSPTPSQANIGLATSLAYQASAIGANQYSNVTGIYPPSAPPCPDYSFQPGVQNIHSAYNNAVAFSTAAPAATPSVQVPMMPPSHPVGGVLLPPNPMGTGAVPVAVAATSRPPVIGNRPVTDPAYFPQGMDPTAPMLTMSQVGPPPKLGFVPKQS